MMEKLLLKFVPNAANTADKEVRAATGLFSGVVGIICNVLLCIGKMAVGVFAGSISIIADALNNLTDAASNIITLMGFKLANRPPDKDHPYGHGRFEYLAGLVVSALVVVVGVELLKSSIEKFMNPTPLEFSWALIVVLVLAIAVKLWMAVFYKKMGNRIDSQTLLATGIDARNDVITTTAVLAASILYFTTGFNADAIMGIAVSVFIIYSGIQLIRETIDPLLGLPPSEELVKSIEKKAMSYPEVLGIHDLMVHDYGPGRLFVSLHAEVAAEKPILESHDAIDRLEADFRANEGMEVVIHLDPIVTSDPRVAEMRHWVRDLLKERIDERITIHDFRMVPGESHTNLIFDAVLPHDNPLAPSEFVKRVNELVRETYPDHFCVIQVDRDFT